MNQELSVMWPLNFYLCAQIFQAVAASVLDPADGWRAFQSNCWPVQIHDHCSNRRSPVPSHLLCSWRLSSSKRSINLSCSFSLHIASADAALLTSPLLSIVNRLHPKMVDLGLLDFATGVWI